MASLRDLRETEDSLFCLAWTSLVDAKTFRQQNVPDYAGKDKWAIVFCPCHPHLAISISSLSHPHGISEPLDHCLPASGLLSCVLATPIFPFPFPLHHTHMGSLSPWITACPEVVPLPTPSPPHCHVCFCPDVWLLAVVIRIECSTGAALVCACSTPFLPSL